jgi:DsbC/DsbD-like thiol-disulfide interchange protein
MKYFLHMLFCIVSAFSVLIAQPSSTAQRVSSRIVLSTDKVQPGSVVQIAIQLNINEGWHVN